MTPDRAALEETLGVRFRDPGLLRLALTHPSAVPGPGPAGRHNQRLEFLGDAVLQLILTTELFRRFPASNEGALTQARAALVNGPALARHARRLQLGRHLVMSPGEERGGGRDRASNLADAFEAVLGAVYLDQGLEAATRLVRECFRAALDEIAVGAATWSNPKGELQERLQTDGQAPPTYELDEVSGPDHARHFVCSVYHRGECLGRGEGGSKKEAEAAAALEALQRLRAPEAPASPARKNPASPKKAPFRKKRAAAAPPRRKSQSR
jgi:ribonuclease-3